MIVIVDYGLGNVGSIHNMFTRSGVRAAVSGEPADVRAATKLVLPGVGSFDTGMGELHASGLVPVLEEQVVGAQVPVLGICLGMQMLGRSSEEGTSPGLGWLDMETVHFDMSRAESPEKVPHMGWSAIQQGDRQSLFDAGESRSYYFSHSYHPRCRDELVLATATYGYEFPCAVQEGNIVGVQFHPEKSHQAGVAFFRQFGRAA